MFAWTWKKQRNSQKPGQCIRPTELAKMSNVERETTFHWDIWWRWTQQVPPLLLWGCLIQYSLTEQSAPVYSMDFPLDFMHLEILRKEEKRERENMPGEWKRQAAREEHREAQNSSPDKKRRNGDERSFVKRAETQTPRQKQDFWSVYVGQAFPSSDPSNQMQLTHQEAYQGFSQTPAIAAWLEWQKRGWIGFLTVHKDITRGISLTWRLPSCSRLLQ